MKASIKKIVTRISVFVVISSLFIQLTPSVVLGQSIADENRTAIFAERPYYDNNSTLSNICTAASGSISNKKVYVIGDSYAEGIQSYLRADLQAAGYEVFGYNAHTGRSISGGGNAPNQQSGLEAIKQDSETIKEVGTIIILLGTNQPTTYFKEIPTFMKELNVYNTAARKYWVNTNNLQTPQKDIKEANDSITYHSKEFNYSVVDWYSASNANMSRYISSDRLHPSSEGYKLMSKLIIDTAGAPATLISDSSITTKATPEENAVQIWAYFIGKGFTPYQVAGIMGNLQAESAFMPNRVQGRAIEDGSDNFNLDWLNSLGYGLAQWTSGGRQQGLIQLADKRGVNDSDLLLQLDYIMQEFNNGYKSAYDGILSSTTIREATDIMLNEYERPAERDLDGRTKLAEQVLAKYGGGGGIYPGCSSSLVAGEGGWDLSGPNAMVYYSQTDPKWADQPYGNCPEDYTIATSGCGPTSMAMVVSTLTSTKITPPEMAKLSVENGFRTCGLGTSRGLASFVADKYGLKYSAIGRDLDKAAQILSNGGLVWISVDAGTFTSGGHIMLLRKVTDDGNSFYLADPISEAGRTNGESNTKAYTRNELIGEGNLDTMFGFEK